MFPFKLESTNQSWKIFNAVLSHQKAWTFQLQSFQFHFELCNFWFFSNYLSNYMYPHSNNPRELNLPMSISAMSLTWIGDPVGQFLIEFVKPGLRSGESAFGSIFSIFPSWWTTWSWKRGDVEEIFDNLSFPFILFKISWLSSRAKFSVRTVEVILGRSSSWGGLCSISNVISSAEFERLTWNRNRIKNSIVCSLNVILPVTSRAKRNTNGDPNVWLLHFNNMIIMHVSHLPFELLIELFLPLVAWFDAWLAGIWNTRRCSSGKSAISSLSPQL